MSPIQEIIKKNTTNNNPIWLMRQAGRYLPEFREIRKENKNFINLCLNENLTPEITLQPLKRFEFDAAIIFSDILMVPHGLGQKVEFKKDFGPLLDFFDLKKMKDINEEEFSNKLKPVYNSLKIVSKNEILHKKDLIGFVGAPWTLFVYMLHQKSPKLIKNIKDLFVQKISDEDQDKLMKIIIEYLKVHIKNQIKSGATIIQIFDSWAGLLNNEKDIEKYIYKPTYELVEFTKNLSTPVICFPRGTNNYKKFCEIVKPDVINIDYDVDPKLISKEINIPVQGGLDPKFLLTDKEILKEKATTYLETFKDKPYIFNLGHGVLPQTNPEIVEYLVKLVKDFK